MIVSFKRNVTTPVLLYDAECGFCDRVVRFALRRDPRGALRFAGVQGEHGRRIIARHPELAGVDSLLWVESNGASERVWTRSDGALRLLRYLGGIWRVLAALGRLIPRGWRDAAYDAFGRRRYRWFGRVEACTWPTAEERARFIDAGSSTRL